MQHIVRAVPVCADESVHDRASLATLAERYDAVNIKLDKTGGLTEALATAAEARELGLKIMVGCMVATSLAMAPALLLAQDADWVDLDGPLLLARDRVPGLAYTSARSCRRRPRSGAEPGSAPTTRSPRQRRISKTALAAPISASTAMTA